VLVAMALTVSIISCNNEKMAEKYQQEMNRSTFASFEDSFEKSKFLLQEDPELEEVIIPEELETETTVEAGLGR
jgi:hypothetical protein